MLSVIACDGDMVCPTVDHRALVEASKHPVSFVVLSVGPEDDESLLNLERGSGRLFGNVSYVNVRKLRREFGDYQIRKRLAHEALCGIVKQVEQMEALGLLDKRKFEKKKENTDTIEMVKDF